MIDIQKAIYALNSSVVTIRGEDAFDQNDNPVVYDKAAVAAEIIRLQAEQEEKKQMQINARQSALNKLMTLGLTEEEALALGVRP